MNDVVRLGSCALLFSILWVGPALGFAASAAEKPSPVPSKGAATALAATPPDPTPHTKVVSYSKRDVIAVNTKLRFTSLIVLPAHERILDFTVGDKEGWVVEGAESFAYVKPVRVGASTNMNLVTASGNVYSFLLTEVSKEPEAEADLKIFVESKASTVEATESRPRFVSAAEVENYRRQVEIAKEETREAKQAAQEAIDRGITTFISNVRFPYRFEAGKAPFNVRSMYRDDRFTYIRARPEETPTLYEIRDGKPNLVNFDYRDGVYVTDRIIGRGYLAIGKRKLAFQSEED